MCWCQMILEIFVAIFVVIFTTMMATSSTGYESDFEKYSRLQRDIENLKKKGTGGVMEEMQKAGEGAEKHYKYFGVNMGDANPESGKPKNKGPFEGGALGQLIVEAAPPPIEGKGKKYGGKYEELKPCRDGADGIKGIDGIGEKGEKGDKGEPGLGGGKGGGGGEDDVAEYLKKGGLTLIIENNSKNVGVEGNIGDHSPWAGRDQKSLESIDSTSAHDSIDSNNAYAVETTLDLLRDYGGDVGDIKANKDELTKEYGSNTYENAVKILDLAGNDKGYNEFKKYITDRKSQKLEYNSDEEKKNMIYLANNVIEKYQPVVSGLHKLGDKSSIKNIDTAMKKIEGFRKYIEKEIK